MPQIRSRTPEREPVVVDSMGDSYSSGEGVPPFYGQDKPYQEKKEDLDWLAHRSTIGWPARLEIPTISGHAKDYKDDTSSRACQWYFVASSGATTWNYRNEQSKELYEKKADYCEIKMMPAQLKVFDKITDTVDYVTMTIGGNDVDFADVITTAATKSHYLGSKDLDNKLNSLWNNIGNTKAKLKQVYKDVAEKAPNAAIIVAGYPQLLEKTGKGFLFSKAESEAINEKTSAFNKEIKNVVNTCRAEGMDIHFVDVEKEFDKDGGHQAFSKSPWINEIVFGAQSEELNQKSKTSAYSMHPNVEGVKAYARCVNAEIRKIYNDRVTWGTLSGKVCKANDRVTPIANAEIVVYQDNQVYKTLHSDSSGRYSISLPEGEYRIRISADGYITFESYATVSRSENTYLETFLMVEGTEGQRGIASGRISDAVTGYGLEGVSLTIRKGWNNTSVGDVLATATTQANGEYSVELPIGNYTMYAEKVGYISAAVNIIVQEGTTDLQHGVLSPMSTGDHFRIVLSWGANPRDLDSHVAGMMSTGNSFHVYYANKYEYDGDIEVCNLDVDDTDSYGPETITLKPTVNEPYYYYIHRYAGEGTVASSEAQVKVYSGERLLRVFNVPTDRGTSDYWNVFAVVNGQLVIKNTMTTDPDLNYVAGTMPRVQTMQIAPDVVKEK